MGSRPGYVKGTGYGVDASRKRQYNGFTGAGTELKERLSELENAKEKIIDLTDAYEEQNKILEEQKKEMETCKEQSKTYSLQIDALQTQMPEMQQLLKTIAGLNPNSK